MKKKIITLLLVAFVSVNTNFAAILLPKAAVAITSTSTSTSNVTKLSEPKPDFSKMSVKTLEKFSGRKLNIFQKAAFKLYKKSLKKGDTKISKGLYVVLSILGLGWLAMGILDDWSGNDWIISLVLTFLFWLPGLIFSLVKMKKYYN